MIRDRESEVQKLHRVGFGANIMNKQISTKFERKKEEKRDVIDVKCVYF